jgi:hypothetical protein
MRTRNRPVVKNPVVQVEAVGPRVTLQQVVDLFDLVGQRVVRHLQITAQHVQLAPGRSQCDASLRILDFESKGQRVKAAMALATLGSPITRLGDPHVTSGV